MGGLPDKFSGLRIRQARCTSGRKPVPLFVNLWQSAMAVHGLFVVPFFFPEHGYTTSEGVLTRFEVWIPASVFARIVVRAYQVRKVGGGGAAWYASKEAVGLGRDASPSSDDLRRLPAIL
jgi:hypothetical protein